MMGKKRQVFNLGFSKTGTTSIEDALGILGYRVARGHWQNHFLGFLEVLCVNRDFEEVLRFTQSYDAFCDAPWGGGTNIYEFLTARLPDARFLLTIRAPDAWYRSFETMLTVFDGNLNTALSSYADAGFWTSVYWFRRIFDIQELAGEKEKIIARYEEYNRRVIGHFAALNRPLLILDLSEGHGWKPLCDYLEEPVPEQCFPHTNAAMGRLDTKLILHRDMRRRLHPVPSPLARSPKVRAGVLAAEGQLLEAASILEELHNAQPDDPDIALETSFTAFAAGRNDAGSGAFEAAARMIDSSLIFDSPSLDIMLRAMMKWRTSYLTLAAAGVAWLIHRRGPELKLADETTATMLRDLAAALHDVDYLTVLNLPDRLRRCTASAGPVGAGEAALH
jgi:hypothetical protein